MSQTLSPELALVDPALRLEATASLPHLEPFDFLRDLQEPRRHPDLERFGFLAEYGDAETFRREPPLAVAAAVYLALAVAKTVVFDGAFLLIVLGLVVLVNVVG